MGGQNSTLFGIRTDPVVSIGTAVLFSITGLIALFFSLFVLILIISNWRSHCRSITNLLSCNTCVIVLVHVIAVSIHISALVQQDPQEFALQNPFFCKFRAYLYLASMTALVNSYLLQSISRYFIIIHYRRRDLINFRFNIQLILIGWSISMIGPATYLFIPNALQYEIETGLCVLTSKVFPSSFSVLIIFFMGPTITIALLYISIIHHISINKENHFFKCQAERNMKVFKLIFIHMINLTLCGLPFTGLVIFNRFIRPPMPLYRISISLLSLSVPLSMVTLFLTNNDVRRFIFSKKTVHPTTDYVLRFQHSRTETMPKVHVRKTLRPTHVSDCDQQNQF